MEHELEIIPGINKIDLQAADIDRTRGQIDADLGLDSDSALLVSAKEGIGIEELFERIVKQLPPPRGNQDAPLKALIFDSNYDSYRGPIFTILTFDGALHAGAHLVL